MSLVKKAIVLILAVMYMVTSSGATINMHYCMGKLVDWSIGHNEEHTCSNCGMEKNGSENSCCKDEYQHFKLDKDQKTAEAAVQSMQVTTASIPVSYQPFSIIHITRISEDNPRSHAPPYINSVSPNILHCVFRI